ncbi:SDR family oxidoreductase [Streptomyces sp. AV19]|uniref:SDR family NAD(P)-dependent oxidoreductase n=1 Tax=Streptomyces sp. AV19 TaxID=2793068 RepID=UPI0018FE27F1|nr:SDR family oxidoreductase [Streptomyces sp. AV19]MBH1938053.1 SDR family oxidoreductase [Streptomyces sp. AV19]MDG4536667.1 SDR family oxidoreductase [Streptomyces sp. AV19]
MTAPDRIALVTGANRGVGRATALRLAEDGTDVIITYRSHPDEADAVVDAVAGLGRTAFALPLDLSDLSAFGTFTGDVRRVLRDGWERDTFDFLVNNAGVGARAPFAETTVEDFDQLMNVNFRGVYFLTQKLLPLIADGGRIINVSSGLTRTIVGDTSAYASVKGAVEILTRCLAKELGPRGITANTVAPGAVATDLGGGRFRDDAAERARVVAQTALGRVGRPEDIGGVIASLLSEHTGWINAQTIEASGGTPM